MKQAEVKRFDSLYAHHLKLLKLQGKSEKTIEAYLLAKLSNLSTQPKNYAIVSFS